MNLRYLQIALKVEKMKKRKLLIVCLLIILTLLSACWFLPKPEKEPNYLVAFDHYSGIGLLNVNDNSLIDIADLNFEQPYWTFVGDFSDDGQYLLFTKDTLILSGEDLMSFDGYDIYCYDVSNDSLAQLTDNDVYEKYPRFSPSGEQVVFMAMNNGNWDIFLVNRDGSDRHPLMVTEGWEYDPRFSADGQYIYYKINRNDQYDICRNTLDGLNEANLTNDTFEEGSFVVTQDGNTLYYNGYENNENADIRKRDLNGGLHTQLTDSGTNTLNYFWPKLSPGEDLVSYIYTSDWMSAYLMNSDGSDPIKIGRAYDCECSTDGEYLFYLNDYGVLRYEIDTGIIDTLRRTESGGLKLEVAMIK